MPHGLAASWPDLKKEMTCYDAVDGVEEPLRRLYEDIFQVWYRCLGRVSYTSPWEAEQMHECFRRGRFLLAGQPLFIDAAIFREVLEQVTAALRHFPESKELAGVTALPGLQGENLERFLAESASFDGEEMQRFLREQGWDKEAGVEADLLAFILFTSLAPFYLAMADAVSAHTDFSLWREGYCPLCGQKPGMAKLKETDGARVLECRLCHIQWQFPRLECPFCRNRDFNALHFFYTEAYPGRRVQLCERCKSYLKTVAVKEIGREVYLELENIYTIQLDVLARREGYRPGEDLAVLI